MWGTRERVTKARSASDSGEYRDPRMRTVCAAGPVRRFSLRAVADSKIIVARWRRAPMSRRKPSGSMSRTRPGLLHPGGQVGPLPGEQADAADELARAEHADGLLALDVGPHDLDLAVEHHVEALGPAAGPQQLLAHGHVALDAVRGQLGERLGVPCGEGLGR